MNYLCGGLISNKLKLLQKKKRKSPAVEIIILTIKNIVIVLLNHFGEFYSSKNMCVQ